eukprot:jgi/Galph1/5247/GphlegSOOS_G3876.1
MSHSPGGARGPYQVHWDTPHSSCVSSKDYVFPAKSFKWEAFTGTVVLPTNTYLSSSSDLDDQAAPVENFCFEGPAKWDSSIVTVHVELKTPLTYNGEQEEFRWLKAWRLPDIRVNVVKFPSSTDSNTIVGGECCFSRLRLTSTSSSYGGRKFHIVVGLFSLSGTCEAALISSSFSVYSRSQPEKTKKRTVTSGISGVSDEKLSAPSLFSPELFDKTFIRKFRAPGQATAHEIIDNSAIGLVHYFQATNIRHKCRNPLFLAIRFSSVLVFLRDATLLCEENEDAYWNLLRAFGMCACNWSFNSKSSVSPSLSPSGSPVWFLSMRENQSISTETQKIIADNLESASLENTYNLRRVYEKMFVMESQQMNVNYKTFPVKEQSATTYDSMLEQRENLSDIEMYYKSSSPDSDDLERNYLEDPAESFLSIYNLPFADTTSINHETVARNFQTWFQQLHKDLRHTLERMNQLASSLVMHPSESAFQNLKVVCERFLRSLRIHSFIEDHTLFFEISRRLPGIVEAYHLDHNMESDDLKTILDMVNSFNPSIAGDLFLRITGFSSQFQCHVEKEEEHLVPRLLNVMSGEELADLFSRLRTEIASLEERSVKEV